MIIKNSFEKLPEIEINKNKNKNILIYMLCAYTLTI